MCLCGIFSVFTVYYKNKLNLKNFKKGIIVTHIFPIEQKNTLLYTFKIQVFQFY